MSKSPDEPTEDLPDTPPEPESIPPPKKAQKLIDKATQAAERLEAANKEMDALLTRKEELAVEDTLAGSASAGQPTQAPDHNAGAKKILEGTGYEDMFDEEKK